MLQQLSHTLLSSSRPSQHMELFPRFQKQNVVSCGSSSNHENMHYYHFLFLSPKNKPIYLFLLKKFWNSDTCKRILEGRIDHSDVCVCVCFFFVALIREKKLEILQNQTLISISHHQLSLPVHSEIWVYAMSWKLIFLFHCKEDRWALQGISHLNLFDLNLILKCQQGRRKLNFHRIIIVSDYSQLYFLLLGRIFSSTKHTRQNLKSKITSNQQNSRISQQKQICFQESSPWTISWTPPCHWQQRGKEILESKNQQSIENTFAWSKQNLKELKRKSHEDEKSTGRALWSIRILSSWVLLASFLLCSFGPCFACLQLPSKMWSTENSEIR